MQRAGRSYFQTVIVNGYSYGAAAYGVVAMAKRVRQSFASGERRIQWFVDSFETTRFDTPGDRQCVQKKTFRMREKREGVAMELPVVHKFGAVDALEAGDAKQALRYLEFEALGTAEQYGCRPQQVTASEQPQTAQHFCGFPSPRSRQPSSPDRFLDRPPDLGLVEIFD